VTAAVGIKRLGIIVAGLAVIGFGLLVALPLIVSADAVREAVKAEIRAVTGLDPVLRGSAKVALVPAGSVSFEDVSLGDNRSKVPALTAERVVARLRFFPFLIGRIEIADVSLVRPTIAVIFNADRSSNWSSHIDSLAQNLKPGAAQTASFSEIRIEDGTVILRDEAYKLIETLSHVDAALAWPAISKSFAATGRFAWHDEPIDATVSIADFVSALRGDKSGLKVRLAGAPFKFAYDGYISSRPTLKMEGTLAADTASLRDTLRWAGQQPPPGGGFGRFALKAQTNVVGGTIGLERVNVELDGNAGEGALTFDVRQTLQGTLAADGLDLSPYVSTTRLMTGGERGWDSKPIALDGLEGLDVDLRLSAARVAIGNARLGQTAVGVTLHGGQLNVAVGKSQAFGGVVTGSLGLAKSPAGADVKAQLQFANVDLEQCLAELFSIRKLEGKGNLGFAIESSGGSVYDLTKALNGTANLTSRNGAIAGLNVEQLLRRIERRPLSGVGDFRTGKTPYDELTVNLRIEHGVANVEKVSLEGPAVALALTGSASIPEREIDLRGTATLLSNETNAAAFELPFMVQGPFSDPSMLPDPLIRMQRSGAAAPLLDAVRNRDSREAVRSVLERLRGAAGVPAARPAAAPAETAPALAGSSSQPVESPEPAEATVPPAQSTAGPQDGR
jgi:AsmA protein